MSKYFKYIYRKDGVTYFDDYFDYLSSVADVIPPIMRAFFCATYRYAINHEFTLHDAWLEQFLLHHTYNGHDKRNDLTLRFLLATHEK